MIKAIFIDIDGTLQNSRSEISVRTKEAIQKVMAKGIFIILTTGRGLPFAWKLQKELSLSPYIIGSNGGEIYDLENNQSIFCTSIPSSTIEEVYRYILKHQLHLYVNCGLDRYSDISTGDIREKLITEENCSILNASQLVVYGTDFSQMSVAYQLFLNHPALEIINYSSAFLKQIETAKPSYFFDLVPKNQADKGKAVLKFLEYQHQKSKILFPLEMEGMIFLCLL